MQLSNLLPSSGMVALARFATSEDRTAGPRVPEFVANLAWVVDIIDHWCSEGVWRSQAWKSAALVIAYSRLPLSYSPDPDP